MLSKSKQFNRWFTLFFLSIAFLLNPLLTVNAMAANYDALAEDCVPCNAIAKLIEENPALKDNVNLKERQLIEPKLEKVKEIKGNQLFELKNNIFADPQVESLINELKEQGFVVVEDGMEASKVTAKFKNKNTEKNETVETTTAKILLTNDKQEQAVVSYVSNKFGVGAVALVEIDGTPTLMIPNILEEGNIKAGSYCPVNDVECYVCRKAVEFIYDLPQWSSCKIMCGIACLVFVECPLAMAACNTICNPICNYVIQNPGSASDAYETCVDLGWCHY